MGDMGIETPRADAAEQRQLVVPADADAAGGPVAAPPLEVSEADAAGQAEDAVPGESDQLTPPQDGGPLEASPADVAEQELALGTADDEYR